MRPTGKVLGIAASHLDEVGAGGGEGSGGPVWHPPQRPLEVVALADGRGDLLVRVGQHVVHCIRNHFGHAYASLRRGERLRGQRTADVSPGKAIVSV